MDSAYRISGSHIIHEEVDGEVIIVDLSTGSYYSLTGSCSEIWDGIVSGDPAPAILASLENRYAAPRAELAGAVTHLVSQLETDRLVTLAGRNGEPVTSSMPANGHTESPGHKELPGVNGRVPFVQPKLESFDDMKDLMLLDPIHEVSTEQGWPHRPEAS